MPLSRILHPFGPVCRPRLEPEVQRAIIAALAANRERSSQSTQKHQLARTRKGVR